jgi:hypothetical protein
MLGLALLNNRLKHARGRTPCDMLIDIKDCGSVSFVALVWIAWLASEAV